MKISSKCPTSTVASPHVIYVKGCQLKSQWSLPGTLCQFPAWERLPMPCLGMFVSPCLGHLPVPCLGTPFAGTPPLAELFSYAYRTSMRRELLRLFKLEMPRTPVPCYFASAMNVKGRECKAKEKRTNSNQ